MAIQGISYRYCPNGTVRYFGIDDATGDLVGHPTDGPDIGGSPVQDDDYDFDASCKNNGTSVFNDGTWKVTVKSSYPYGTVTSIGSPPPPPPPPPLVCALSLSEVSVSNASTLISADGSFAVSAVDPNTTLAAKFKIGADFNYVTGDGQLGTTVSGVDTKTFTGLLPGIYTVYVRNSNGCLATIGIEVGVEDRYSPLYRLAFDDYVTGQALAQPRYRFDIEELDYTGAVIEVEGEGERPVTVRWEGQSNEDPFVGVIASSLTVMLRSETDQKYLNLYSSNDRKYRGKLWEYNGSSYELKWVGFMSPMLYSEPYVLQTEYTVSFTFVDLGTLSEQAFGGATYDIFNPTNLLKGRKALLDGIIICLQKTGIVLDIWESANLYTTAMDQTDDDSMLTQVAFDVDAFNLDDTKAEDCLTVLTAIMEAIGCRLYQAEGRWNIELVSHKTASTVLTRAYDYNKTYISTSSLTPRLLVRRATGSDPKAVFSEQSAYMKIAEQWGVVIATWLMGIEEENNLLVRGDFNPEDVVNGQFTGWSVTKNGTPEVGIEQLSENRGNTDTALYVDFAYQSPGAYVDLTATPVDLALMSPFAALRIKFDVLVRPVYKEAYAFIDFALGFNDDSVLLAPDETGGLMGQSTGAGWVNDVYKRVFIDEMLTWKTIDLTIPVSEAEAWYTSLAGPMNLRMRLYGNSVYDLANKTALKALTVDYSATGRTTVNQYAKARVLDTQSGVQVIRVYKFEAVGGGVESDPDLLVPTAGNSYGYWKLEKTVPLGGFNNWIQQMLVTNVQVSYLPGGGKPTETVSGQEVVDIAVRRTYVKEQRLSEITAGISMDNNYKYLTNRWLSYVSSGAPVNGTWARKGVTEDMILRRLLAKMYQGQFLPGRWKLSGSLTPYGVTPSFYNTFHELRTGRVYLPMAMEVDYRARLFNVEMIESLKGAAVVDEGDPEIPVIEPPVALREHTEEFTNEFS